MSSQSVGDGMSKTAGIALPFFLIFTISSGIYMFFYKANPDLKEMRLLAIEKNNCKIATFDELHYNVSNPNIEIYNEYKREMEFFTAKDTNVFFKEGFWRNGIFYKSDKLTNYEDFINNHNFYKFCVKELNLGTNNSEDIYKISVLARNFGRDTYKKKEKISNDFLVNFEKITEKMKNEKIANIYKNKIANIDYNNNNEVEYLLEEMQIALKY